MVCFVSSAKRDSHGVEADALLLLGSGFTFVALSIKNPFFRDEREWRRARVILSGLSQERAKIRMLREAETPYEEITLVDESTGDSPIVEIVLGPMTRSDATVGEVRSLLDRNNLEHVTIRKSIGPYVVSGSKSHRRPRLTRAPDDEHGAALRGSSGVSCRLSTSPESWERTGIDIGGPLFTCPAQPLKVTPEPSARRSSAGNPWPW